MSDFWTHTTLVANTTGAGANFQLPTGTNLLLIAVLYDDDLSVPTWDGNAMTEAYKSSQVYGEIAVYMLDVTAHSGLVKAFAVTSTTYSLIVVDGLEAEVVDSTYEKATQRDFNPLSRGFFGDYNLLVYNQRFSQTISSSTPHTWVHQVNSHGVGYTEARNPFVWTDIRADPSAGEIGVLSITFRSTFRPHQPELIFTDATAVGGSGITTTIPTGWKSSILFAFFVSNNTTSPGSGPLCDGNAMTQLGSINPGSTSSLCAYYKNPPTGSINIDLTSWNGLYQSTIIALVEIGTFPDHYFDDDSDPADFATDYDYKSVILEFVSSRSTPSSIVSVNWPFETADDGNLDFTLAGTYGHDGSTEDPGYVDPNNHSTQFTLLVELLKRGGPLPVMLGSNF